MSQIPAHLLAVLSGNVRAVAPGAIVAPRDRAPVFTPSQGGVQRAPRTLSSIIEECTLECHEGVTLGDNEDPDNYAVSISD
jgi:hypothetical protein